MILNTSICDMGTISAPTQNTRISRRPRRESMKVYRPPVVRGEAGMMKEGSLIESQHAPKSTTQGTSYADIMATSPPKQPDTVEVVPSQPSENDISSAPTDESAASPEPETVLMEHLESLHLSSSAKPVVALPAPVATPAPFPQVPSEISTFDLPSPVSTRESSHVN